MKGKPMQKQMLLEILHIANEADNRKVHMDHQALLALTKPVCNTERAEVGWMFAVIGNINLN